MINKILKIMAVAQAVAFSSINAQKANEPIKGYQIYGGQYVSEILIGDISHDYIGDGKWELGKFTDTDTNKIISISIWTKGGIVEQAFIQEAWSGLVDWEKSGLTYDNSWRYIIPKTNFCLYLKKPLQASDISERTNLYLSYTSPAQTFAAGYDGFIPSYYYTSISGNKGFLDSITSVSSLIEGKLWTSGNVKNLLIEDDGFIIQYYYVYASVDKERRVYDVWLRAFAESKDGQKVVDINISELVYVNLNENRRVFKSYDFPDPVPTLEAKSGYYNIIRSSGAYGLTDSIKNYEEGYKDGQGNPTFKSFIVSAFEACSSFFSLPVLGEHITIGTLIGSFVGLGALFLIIKLFR